MRIPITSDDPGVDPDRHPKRRTTMSNYRKLIVAAVGVAIMWANMYFGVDLGTSGPLTDAIIAILTAAGVWAAPNTPAV